jgi:hypothetical protein
MAREEEERTRREVRRVSHGKPGMDERRSDGSERFGRGKIALIYHHTVDVGKDLIDEPPPAGRAGFCRIDIWRRAPLIVDEPRAVGAGVKPPR